jgi:hypothetical protein
MFRITQHKSFPEGGFPHALDGLATAHADRAASFVKVGTVMVLGDTNAEPGNFAYVGAFPDGINFDMNDSGVNGTVGRAAAMIGAVAELADEMHGIATDKRRSQFSIDEASREATVMAAQRVINEITTNAMYVGQAKGAEISFNAVPPIERDDAASASIDASIVARLPKKISEVADLVRRNPRAALAVLRDPLGEPGPVRDAAQQAWIKHRRAEQPELAAKIDRAVALADWSEQAAKAARRFFIQTAKASGAEIAAGLDVDTLSKFGVAGFDVQRGGQLVVRDAA